MALRPDILNIYDLSTEISTWVRLRPIAATILATAAVSCVFIAVPAIDLTVSDMFFRAGIGFPATSNPAWKALRSLGLLSINLSVGLVVAATLLRCLVPMEWQPPILFAVRPRTVLFLAATLALGPGLITNVVLKDHWGRARPVDIVPFGGEHAFSSPWIISDGCARNCSFVSGEGSGTFWFVALAFVVPARYRRAVLTATLSWAAVIALNRIAFGGHFLSDTVIAWGLMLTVMLICRDLLLQHWGGRIDAAIGRWIDRISDPAYRARSRLGE